MLLHYLIVFFVSMVPLIELRGAIPFSQGFGLPLYHLILFPSLEICCRYHLFIFLQEKY